MPQVARVPRSPGHPWTRAGDGPLSPVSGPGCGRVVAALFALAIGWFGFRGVDVSRSDLSACGSSKVPAGRRGIRVGTAEAGAELLRGLRAAGGRHGLLRSRCPERRCCRLVRPRMLVARWGRTAPALAGRLSSPLGDRADRVGQMPFLLARPSGFSPARTRAVAGGGVCCWPWPAPLASRWRAPSCCLLPRACLLGGARPRRPTSSCARDGLALAAVSLLNVRTGGFPFS